MNSEQVRETLSSVSALMVKHPIETERVRLRPFTEGDFEDYFEYAAQREQQRLSGNVRIDTREDARAVFDSILSPEHPTLCFAIEEKRTGKVIGNFSIGANPEVYGSERLADKRGLSLSFTLNEGFWRQGVMTRLLKRATAFLFETAELDYINCGYFDYNEGSRRLQEKCGFQRFLEGEWEYDGQTIATIETILLRGD